MQQETRAPAPILSGQDIICLAQEPWHGPWKTYQQIMSLLGKSNRVLYVGPPGSLRGAFDRLLKRERRHPVLEQVDDALWVYHEPWLLTRVRANRPWGRPFNWGTGQLRLAHVRWLTKRRGMRAPILWVFDPMMAHAVGTFREKLVVYHVLDNYVECYAPEPRSLRATTANNEAAMLAKADVVFAVSDSLYQRCAGLNRNVFLVPNGVDYDQFQTEIATGRLPSDMALVKRPIIGYVGAIQPDIDFSLLERLSTECPDWSLVFVGPEELGSDRPRFQALIAQPNVHYLGCKPVDDVPAYINGCDVCIMPNCADISTVPDCDSIKLYEYLACGKPVVSTNFPSVHKFGEFVHIARDDIEFINFVKESVGEAANGQDQRKSIAREHTWQKRVSLLSEAIRAQLCARAATGSSTGSALKKVISYEDP